MDIQDARFWNDRQIQDPEIYLNKPFFDNFASTFKEKKYVYLDCPIDRHLELNTKELILDTRSSVKEVLTQIKEFYFEKITKEVIDKEYTNDTSHYADYARTMSEVFRYEMLGSTGFGPYGDGARHPLFCNGRVRYEGFHYNKNTKRYYLCLGS